MVSVKKSPFSGLVPKRPLQYHTKLSFASSNSSADNSSSKMVSVKKSSFSGLVPKRPLQYYTKLSIESNNLRSNVLEKSLDAVPNTQSSKLTLDPLVFMGCTNSSEFVNEFEQHLDSLSFEEISLFGKVCWAMFDYSWFKLSFLYIMVI